MSRRVSLPAADALFRPGEGADTRAQRSAQQPVHVVPDSSGPGAGDEADKPRRRPSGRVRHDEKMTVYVTSAELLELERTRLSLRAQHGLAVDRGRLVREAIHLVLEDYEAHGDDSILVRRLNEE